MDPGFLLAAAHPAERGFFGESRSPSGLTLWSWVALHPRGLVGCGSLKGVVRPIAEGHLVPLCPPLDPSGQLQGKRKDPQLTHGSISLKYTYF